MATIPVPPPTWLDPFLGRRVVPIAFDYVTDNADDVILQSADGHTITLTPTPNAGTQHQIVMNGVGGTVTSANPVDGVNSISLLPYQTLVVTWDVATNTWVASLIDGTTIEDGVIQGLVEYDMLGDPSSAPLTVTFTDEWATTTTSVTNVVLVNPVDPNRSGIFNALGIILDDNTVTRVDSEVTAYDPASGSAAEWKLSQSWSRVAGGAPVVMRAATLISDTDGTNGPGAAPVGWTSPDLTMTSIGGVYYCQPITGHGLSLIHWASLTQWRKTK